MASDPAFLFYPGDYLRDTQCLSEKVQVAYDRIMCEHMRNLCVSQKQLKFFTKRLDESEMEDLLMVLDEISGGYQIKWVAESISKRKAYSESRRQNRGGKTSKDKTKTSNTHDTDMEDANEIVNRDTNKESTNNLEEKKENTNNLYPNEKFRYSKDYNVNQAAEIVCNLFHITETQNFRSFSTVYSCLELINTSYGMDSFTKQVEAYREFKIESKQEKHRFNRFLGDPAKKCDDGAWCSQDWVQVLADLKKKENPNEKEAPQVTYKEMVEKGK